MSSEYPEQQTIFERLELKYRITETEAEAIRSDLRGFCYPDEHNKILGGRGYPLHSLYLDTDSYAFYRSKIRGDADRYKLRVRSYDEDGPLHFEVKRKCRDVIRKTRVAVAREEFEDAARGYGKPLRCTEETRRILDGFSHLLAQTGAEPKLNVTYEREAYVSDHETYARVTFDRQIVAAPVLEWDPSIKNRDWTYLDGDSAAKNGGISVTILELKSETRLPAWMIDLIRSHRLLRSGFSKYCSGVEATGLCEFQPLSISEGWGDFCYA